jgi:hemerythrin-like domain-containing protein
MPIVIGARPESSFQEPIGLLYDCHRRIERFLSVLVRVATQAKGCELTGDERTAFETALRYFREAAPQHTADEEESLFPRLRKMRESETMVALRQIETLEQDHLWANRAQAEADRLGQAWLASGTLAMADAACLSSVLMQLSGLYERHIAVEEREVFPVAAQVLGAEDRKSIGEEMAARRGLSEIGRSLNHAGAR